MTDAELLRLCKRAERLLRPVLGIGSEWEILWRACRDEDHPGTAGRCDLQAEYRRAWIRIWPERMPERLLDTIVHELCHVTQWPFRLYSDMVDEHTPEEKRSADACAWSHATKQHVTAVLMPSAPVRAAVRELARKPTKARA